jgi:intracellular septation protein A
MRILLVLVFLIFGGTYIFSEFFADKIVKNILEKELSLVAERKVKIQDLKINFLNESAVINDITVANKNNFPGNLIK